MKGSVHIVQELLTRQDIDVNKANNEGNTPLWAAAKASNVEVMRKLLDHPKIEADKANIDNYSPLYFAVLQSCVECVELC